MNFPQAIVSGFRHYATFSGRAARSEYWYWILFLCLVYFAASAVDGIAFPGADPGPVNNLTALLLTLPGLALGARRLHDIGRSGWWQLLVLTLIGIIPLFIWSCMRGTNGPNRFGPDPLRSSHRTSTAVAST